MLYSQSPESLALDSQNQSLQRGTARYSCLLPRGTESKRVEIDRQPNAGDHTRRSYFHAAANAVRRTCDSGRRG